MQSIEHSLVCVTFLDIILRTFMLFQSHANIKNDPILNIYQITNLIVPGFGDLTSYVHLNVLKADMKSYKSLETAAIFYSSEPFPKQGIS